MHTPTSDSSDEFTARSIHEAVEAYQADANVATLIERLQVVAATSEPDVLMMAVEPYRDIPEIAGPVYETVVARRPTNARALVILANAYWLAGRGPEVVGDLATRAMAADPANRGAWHLWALTEGNPRQRVGRWRQVCERFVDDDLARANLADNAASLAGAEHDREALALAISNYETLRTRASHPEQRAALDSAITTLKSWTL